MWGTMLNYCLCGKTIYKGKNAELCWFHSSDNSHSCIPCGGTSYKKPPSHDDVDNINYESKSKKEKSFMEELKAL